MLNSRGRINQVEEGDVYISSFGSKTVYGFNRVHPLFKIAIYIILHPQRLDNWPCFVVP